MKLLSKLEAQLAQNSEKRVEVEAGLKLAKKVDELREMNSKEEQNLEKFKNETSKIVQKQIDDLIMKKNALDYEVRVLEGKNKLLKKPFEDEWESISNKTIMDLENMDASLKRREGEVSKTEIELYERTRLFFAEQNSLRDKLRIAEQNADETTRKLKEVDEIWTNSKLRESEVNRTLDFKLKDMAEREANVASQERDFAIREDAIMSASKTLAQREKFINDKYKQLAKSVEEQKKKGLSIKLD
jgi:alkylhydroperoxidase/carboxymuconolactone decarboxylase family protein YurZ